MPPLRKRQRQIPLQEALANLFNEERASEEVAEEALAKLFREKQKSTEEERKRKREEERRKKEEEREKQFEASIPENVRAWLKQPTIPRPKKKVLSPDDELDQRYKKLPAEYARAKQPLKWEDFEYPALAKPFLETYVAEMNALGGPGIPPTYGYSSKAAFEKAMYRKIQDYVEESAAKTVSKDLEEVASRAVKTFPHTKTKELKQRVADALKLFAETQTHQKPPDGGDDDDDDDDSPDYVEPAKKKPRGRAKVTGRGWGRLPPHSNPYGNYTGFLRRFAYSIR